MPASAVITVRMDPDLVAALKAKAEREGRTVSAEVVRLVELGVSPARPGSRKRVKRRTTSGMFAGVGAPELDELQAGRRAASLALLASAARELERIEGRRSRKRGRRST